VAAGPAAPPAQAPYEGPLVDSHGHLDADSGADGDTLIAVYDATGVRGGWVFGVPWTRAATATARYPERLVPFLGEEYRDTLAIGSIYRDAAGIDALLGERAVRGIGEMILRHSAFRLGPAGGNASGPASEVPADDPALLAVYAAAGRRGVPVVVHQEAGYAAELERALAASPDTLFVWSHAGHGQAAMLQPLLARYPNLHVDLAARTPWIGAGTVLTDGDGALRPEWAGLIAEYPDRFLIGFDLFVPAHFRLPYVGDTVRYYRRLLGQLDPATVEAVAYRNADRLAPPLIVPASER
jgi:hypothetical protein